MAASSLSADSVVIIELFHDLTRKRSSVSVVWDYIALMDSFDELFGPGE